MVNNVFTNHKKWSRDRQANGKQPGQSNEFSSSAPRASKPYFHWTAYGIESVNRMNVTVRIENMFCSIFIRLNKYPVTYY